MATQAEIANEEVTPESTDTIAMDIVDIRIGVLLEIEAAKAQARLQAITDMGSLYANEMREKYKATEGYRMVDWVTGFERVEVQKE